MNENDVGVTVKLAVANQLDQSDQSRAGVRRVHEYPFGSREQTNDIGYFTGQVAVLNGIRVGGHDGTSLHG